MPRQRKEVDTSTFDGRFAMRLKTLREKAGYTVEQVMYGSEIPIRTLYDWESAKSSPPVKYLPILATIYGVSVRVLLPKE
jgi:transcriptional regulator with XRE-family HTH domain